MYLAPMNVIDQLDQIELKARQLLLKLERLRLENAELKEENEHLKAELDKQRGAVGVLKDKLEKTHGVLELPKGNDSEQAQQLRQQLDQYIREIDKCIEWLHNY
jgi:regulator of replication initiation timing